MEHSEPVLDSIRRAQECAAALVSGRLISIHWYKRDGSYFAVGETSTENLESALDHALHPLPASGTIRVWSEWTTTAKLRSHLREQLKSPGPVQCHLKVVMEDGSWVDLSVTRRRQPSVCPDSRTSG